MTIYVGRWDLLPDEWEGISGLYDRSESEIKAEVHRQRQVLARTKWDARVAEYTPQELEAEFNEDIDGSFNTGTYWLKIF